MLLAFWAATLIFGFALLQYGIGGHEQLGNEPITFWQDHLPQRRNLLHPGLRRHRADLERGARALSVLEAGMGFAFLGVVIGYLPVVYASFSRREIQISMLDARADRRRQQASCWCGWRGVRRIQPSTKSFSMEFLRDWERWAGELLESHISYPVLSFFRSQHSNQSWLGALLTMLDVTSLGDHRR